jgi:asparagine synthase (glutamine-hydrolysing)
MCGIAGIFNRSGKPVDEAVLRNMAEIQKHRGPDEDGFYVNANVGLGQRRLSIIDLSGGRQPIHNEEKDIWVVFNGEIFNYPELRSELEKKGHRFYTHTDTETIVHAYEEYGLNFVDHLNGQFAIALWDERQKRLVLARDRVGICPLHYAWLPGGDLVFSSEMKGLFKHPELKPELDPKGVGQIFTFWANVPPRTVFEGVLELPPGHLMISTPEKFETLRYWEMRFPDAGDYEDRPLAYYASGVRELLHDATTLRLRADVPVAAYLSGGIDSSIISALVKKFHDPGLITFSVSFSDAAYDEKIYQLEMARHLDVDHRSLEIDYADIGRVFPQVVWHAEKPMIRTAPAPLYKLAGLVHDNGIKVVLTGEGSDEIFGGYNIFLEDKIRRFWARQPDSKMRPGLLSRLYPEFNKNAASQGFWRQFFRKDLGDTGNPYYSHLIRWQNTAHLQNLFDPSFRERMGNEEERRAELDAYVSPDMMRWAPLCRAQYLETILFMSGYLLSSQGDRMLLGQSIEGRFPFLDHRLIEFAAKIPPRHKIHHLREKHVLKEAFRDLVPARIVERPKQPYRAPISQCFVNPEVGAAHDMLSSESARARGYFDPAAVEQLVTKLKKSGGASASAREDMAAVGIVSLHLLHEKFLKEPAAC